MDQKWGQEEQKLEADRARWPKTAPDGAREPPRRPILGYAGQLEAQNGGQNRPKTVKKSIKKVIKKMFIFLSIFVYRFWSILASILGLKLSGIAQDGPPGRLSGAVWRCLGPSCAICFEFLLLLAPFLVYFAPLGSSLGTILEPRLSTMARLGPPGRLFGAVWRCLGPSCAICFEFLLLLAPFWIHFQPNLAFISDLEIHFR